jgi:integrase
MRRERNKHGLPQGLQKRGNGNYRHKVPNPQRHLPGQPAQVWRRIPVEYSSCDTDAIAEFHRYLGANEEPEERISSRELFLPYALRAIENDGKIDSITKEIHTTRIKGIRWQPIHHMRVSEIRTRHIQSLILQPMLDSGLAGNTIDSYLNSGSKVFIQAREDKLLPNNPVLDCPKSKIPARIRRPRVHVLSEEDLIYLIDSALDHYRVAIAVAGYLGLRPGEVFGLRWGDIGIEQLEVHVQYQLRQNGKPDRKLKTEARGEAYGRIIDMPPALVPYLKEQQRRCGLDRRPNDSIFPRLTYNGFSDWLRSNRERLGRSFNGTDGYKPVTMHKLRHSYGSRLIDAGLPISYVAAQMGDTPETIYKTYIHQINRRESREHAKRLAGVFG